MNFKTEKDLLSSKSAYNRYYGDFRGVDFSSDHTQVADNRFAFAVNMFRDYQSSEGKAIETVPGFRRRFVFPDGEKIYAIHRFCASGKDPVVLIHAGEKLYRWANYPFSVGVPIAQTLTVPEPTSAVAKVNNYTWTLPENVYAVTGLSTSAGESLLPNADYAAQTHTLTVSRSDLSVGETLSLVYTEGEFSAENVLTETMNERVSVSFMFNNRLYILDGKTYRVFDGTNLKNVEDIAYIPTTYINIIPAGENADIGKEYEQRNILQPKFRHTFIADGETTEFVLNEQGLVSVDSVKLYGTEKTVETDYTVDLATGTVKFTTPPPKPETVTQSGGEDENGVKYSEFYAGVEIIASKPVQRMSGVTESTPGGIISGCTIATTFDDRVFLSGNPNFPNHIFWCGKNSTGYSDPTYFGILNYQADGVENAPVTGMIPVADTLAVLKADTVQDGSVYFHSPKIGDSDLLPKQYPSSRGLSGIGCLGACANFLDDPVFISRMGLEGIGQLSVRYERAIEHRSSLIDAKLSEADLKDARLEEWNGYLVLLVGGQIFLADSRQKYTDGTGTVQYEWYYLDNIGVWKDQFREIRYAKTIPAALSAAEVHWCKKCGNQKEDCTCGKYSGSVVALPLKVAGQVYFYETDEEKNLAGTVANAPDGNGEPGENIYRETVSVEDDGVVYQLPIAFAVHEVKDPFTGKSTGFEAYLCEKKENYIGGVFGAASCVKSMDSNLFFGTGNGVVCSFNFDKRTDGGIPTRWYTFDDRTILCGCATKMDCCGIPHLTKNTVKKSTVIKMKSMRSALAKVKVRTNRVPWNQIARINSALFSFEDTDFEDFSFITLDQTLFSVREKEKKWVEKQYYLYSDEYRKPFALYYISYRYTVAGRYKQ